MKAKDILKCTSLLLIMMHCRNGNISKDKIGERVDRLVGEGYSDGKNSMRGKISKVVRERGKYIIFGIYCIILCGRINKENLQPLQKQGYISHRPHTEDTPLEVQNLPPSKAVLVQVSLYIFIFVLVVLVHVTSLVFPYLPRCLFLPPIRFKDT